MEQSFVNNYTVRYIFLQQLDKILGSYIYF